MWSLGPNGHHPNRGNRYCCRQQKADSMYCAHVRDRIVVSSSSGESFRSILGWNRPKTLILRAHSKIVRTVATIQGAVSRRIDRPDNITTTAHDTYRVVTEDVAIPQTVLQVPPFIKSSLAGAGSCSMIWIISACVFPILRLPA
jgi:hypothetical protein